MDKKLRKRFEQEQKRKRKRAAIRAADTKQTYLIRSPSEVLEKWIQEPRFGKISVKGLPCFCIIQSGIGTEEDGSHILTQSEIEGFGLEELIATGALEPMPFRLMKGDPELPAYQVVLATSSRVAEADIGEFLCEVRPQLIAEARRGL